MKMKHRKMSMALVFVMFCVVFFSVTTATEVMCNGTADFHVFEIKTTDYYDCIYESDKNEEQDFQEALLKINEVLQKTNEEADS